MTAKLHGTLGERIRQAYESRGWSRAEFQRQLLIELGKVQYHQIHRWEGGVIPKERQLAAIAKTTGYAVDDFLYGLGIAHPVLVSGEQAQRKAERTVKRFLQHGEHAPFTDDEMSFIELCASAQPSISDAKLEIALLGFRAAHVADEASIARLVSAIRRNTSAPSKPETMAPIRRPRPRGK